MCVVLAILLQNHNCDTSMDALIDANGELKSGHLIREEDSWHAVSTFGLPTLKSRATLWYSFAAANNCN